MDQLKGNRFHIVAFLFFVGFAVLALRSMVHAHGIPVGPEWEMPPFPGQVQEIFQRKLTAWTSAWELGQPRDSPAGVWYNLVIAGLASLGLGGSFIAPFMAILLLALSGYFAFYLARQLRMGAMPALLAGLFYMFVPYVFTRLNMGHLGIVFGYSFFPLALAFFVQFTRGERRLRWMLLATIAVALASVGEAYFVVLLMILGLFFVFDMFGRSRREIWKNLGGLAFIAFGSGALINFFWVDLINQFAYKSVTALFFGGLPTKFLIDPAGIGLKDAFRILDPRLSFTQDVAGAWAPWKLVSFVPTLVSFAALAWRPMDKRILYLSVLSLGGFLLVAGGGAPVWGHVWLWLQLHIGPLAMFRDTPWFYVIPALGLAMLFGLFAHFALRRVQKWKFKAKYPLYGVIFLVLAGMLLSSDWPFLTGNLGGNFQTYYYGPEYQASYQYFASSPDDFRVLPLPAPYLSKFADQQGDLPFVDQMTMYPGKSTLYLDRLYEPQIERFAIKSIYDPRTQDLGQLLGLLNIKYLLLDTNRVHTGTDISVVDNSFPDEEFTNSRISATLAGQKDLPLATNFGPEQVYQNTDYLPHIFAANRFALVAGDLDTLGGLSSLPGVSLDNLGLVFVSQLSARDLGKMSQMPGASVIIADGHYPELLLAAADRQKYELNLLGAIGTGSPTNGWGLLNWYWHNWVFQSSLDRTMYTMVPASFPIAYSVPDNTLYQIYLKLYRGPGASSVKVYSDGQLIGTVATRSSTESFAWFTLGPNTLASGKHVLTLQSTDGGDAVGSVVVIPQNAVEQAATSLAEILKGKSVVTLSKLTDQGSRQQTWGLEGKDLASLLAQGGKRYPADSPYTVSVDGNAARVGMTFAAGQDESYNWQRDLNVPVDPGTDLEFSYRLGDPTVESISLVWYVDFNGDGKPDAWIRTYPSAQANDPIVTRRPDGIYDVSLSFQASAQELSRNFVSDIALGETLPRLFPGEKSFSITGVVMNFEKIPGANTTPGKTYEYRVNYLHVSKGSYFSPRSDNAAASGFALATKLPTYLPEQTLTVPQDGTYQLSLRGSADGKAEPVQVVVNGSAFDTQFDSQPGDYQLKQLGDVDLQKGTVQVALYAPKGNVSLDQLIVSQPLPPAGVPVKISADNVNPTKYEISAQAQQPFFLFFSERYNPRWNISGSRVGQASDYPGYSFGNFYYIQTPGDISLSLDYEGQKVYNIGLPIAFASMVIMLILAALPQRYVDWLVRKVKEKMRKDRPTSL